MLLPLIVSTAIIAMGIISALIIERYYKDLFEVEHNPIEWNLLSYGMMIAFVFNLSIYFTAQNTIELGRFMETILFLVPAIGSFMVMLGSLKLWREFKLD